MAKLISKVYGDALFDIAVESGKTDVFFEEAKGLKQVLEDHPELSAIFVHPDVSPAEKVQVMENVFKDRVSEELVGTMAVALDKGRGGELVNILDYFIARTKEYKKIGVASVTSASELSEGQKKKIVEKLLSSTSYEDIEVSYKVDSALIGGIIIRIGDRVVDGSVRNKLANLKKELSEIKLV